MSNITGKFGLIYSDPPWRYNQRNAIGKAGKTRYGGGAMAHYNTMRLEDICALPVSKIAAKDALLFMWATWPLLPEALQVINAWGFQYVTCGFDWFKVEQHGGFVHGVGYYAKSNSEPCLLARRGKAYKPLHDNVSMAVEVLPQSIKAVPGVHSAKPLEIVRRIERMYPHLRKLEMFARELRNNWVCWGNQAVDCSLLETVNLPTPTFQGPTILQPDLFTAD